MKVERRPTGLQRAQHHEVSLLVQTIRGEAADLSKTKWATKRFRPDEEPIAKPAPLPRYVPPEPAQAPALVTEEDHRAAHVARDEYFAEGIT